jgi:hypothetical protein
MLSRHFAVCAETGSSIGILTGPLHSCAQALVLMPASPSAAMVATSFIVAPRVAPAAQLSPGSMAIETRSRTCHLSKP